VLEASELNAITELPINAKTANHTLVAADAGARVQMTAAGATTITVNDSVFTAGQSVNIYNLGAGTCTITAGTATVTTSGSLALAQYGGGTLLFTSASAATFFPSGGVGYGAATGGTGVVDGPTGYKITSFTSSGTLTVTKAGLFDVLAFGGGSGGGTYTGNTGSSGGGSGGILLDTIYLTANTAVVVGAGGAAGTYGQLTRYGSASTIGSLPSGRVAAGSFSTCNLSTGASEGLLGGFVGSVAGATSTGATNVQGYAGGNSTANTNGGGGGSTTEVGGNGATTAGGNGGAGYDVSTFIGGLALFKGAGGGGSGSVTQGTGGSSVGGNASATNGVAAAANTASGGGAGNTASGAGGSGIIYFRWKA